MKAHPRVGDTYRQEFSPGVAEDQATVLSRDASATVPYGSFDHVLQDQGLHRPRAGRRREQVLRARRRVGAGEAGPRGP